MYCKYCGKQIDDDSTFCKYCGKSLENADKPLEDATHNSENPIKSLKSLNKNLISIILSTILWLIIGAFVSDDSQDYILLLCTLFVAGMIYWFYRNYCKNQFLLLYKSDSPKKKIIKLIYILIIAISPYFCLTSKPIEYAGGVAACWIIPAIFVIRLLKLEDIEEEEGDKDNKL